MKRSTHITVTSVIVETDRKFFILYLTIMASRTFGHQSSLTIGIMLYCLCKNVPNCNNCNVKFCNCIYLAKFFNRLLVKQDRYIGWSVRILIDADANAANAPRSKFNPKLLLTNESEEQTFSINLYQMLDRVICQR